MTFIVSCVLSLKAIIFHAFFSHLIGCLQIITSPVNTLLVLNMNTSSLVENQTIIDSGWLGGKHRSLPIFSSWKKKKTRKEINCNSKITIFCLILSRKSLLYITKMPYCFFFSWIPKFEIPIRCRSSGQTDTLWSCDWELYFKITDLDN